VLIDLATYGPRYPAFRGKTSWSGLVDWEFVCGVHSGGTEASAASSLPYPDFVQNWGSVNVGSAFVRCVSQPPASNRMGRTECMYRTRGTGVRNDMCTNCSTGYVNDLDGIPLRVNWQNRVSFPISEP
jgi:hypothetical protein